MRRNLLLLFCALVILGCEKNPNDPNKESEYDINMVEPDLESVLIPLSVGNSWSYEQLFYMSGEVVEGLTDSGKVKIVGDTTIDYEGQCYRVAIWNDFHPLDEPKDHRWFFGNGTDGMYLLGGVSSTDTIVVKILYRKYPAQEGDTWRVPRLSYYLLPKEFFFDDSITYTCVSTDEEFETPLGTFVCYVYHYRIKPEEDVLAYWEYYDYFAPDIGNVGVIIRSSLTGSLKFRITLYDYHIN